MDNYELKSEGQQLVFFEGHKTYKDLNEMTNGEVFMQVFGEKGLDNIHFQTDWWKEPYKKGK